MADTVFDRVVIPVASEMDARITCEAVLPYLHREEGEVHAVTLLRKPMGP